MQKFQSLANSIANTGLSILTKQEGACVVKCFFAKHHHSVLAIQVQLSAFLVTFFHVADKVCVYGNIASVCTCKTLRSRLFGYADIVVIHIMRVHTSAHTPQTEVSFQFDTYGANSIFP